VCKNAQATAASLMTAIRPTIVSLLTLEGVAGTTEATAALAAYDAAETAIQSWTPGSAATEVLEVIGDLQTALAALPLPQNAIVLLNTILAGVSVVIGVISANSPAPAAPTDSTATPEDITAAHQADVAATTAQKVTALVPGFKRSIFHTPESQYKSAWNSAVTLGGFPASMKV
jgi:hypothetical protein